MGKGDPKTRRGKIFKGTYGKHRKARKGNPAIKVKEEILVAAEEVVEIAPILAETVPDVIKEKKATVIKESPPKEPVKKKAPVIKAEKKETAVKTEKKEAVVKAKKKETPEKTEKKETAVKKETVKKKDTKSKK